MSCGRADLEPTATLPANFDVGAGDICVNVTVQVSLITPSANSTGGAGGSPPPSFEETEVCLPPGHHTYNHTINDVHTVEVVGYANSSVQQGAGGVTTFVVGECIDTFIRIKTSSASSTVGWVLDDDGHNGPWAFTSPAHDSAGPNVFEFESCMFENRFALNVATPSSGWTGTVEVVTKESFENTIIIPNDEAWIVQGMETLGIPVSLEARFESGRTFFEHGCDKHENPDGHVDLSRYPLCTRESLSRASLAVRHVRFSHRQAPFDPFRARYTWSVAADTRLGGVVRYTGGWGAKLIFQHCVFDHLFATSGAAFVVDGQMDERGRPPFFDPNNTAEDFRLTIEISHCLFWEFISTWVGNRFVDINPVTFTLADNQFVDNHGPISIMNIGLYGGTFPNNSGVLGASYQSFLRNEVTAPNGMRHGWMASTFCSYIYAGHWSTGPNGPEERRDISTSVVVADMHCHDIETWYGPCLVLFNRGAYNGGNYSISIEDSHAQAATSTALIGGIDGGAAAMIESDTFEMAHSTFNTTGLSPGVDPEESTLAEGGALTVTGHERVRLAYVSIVGSRGLSRGGAIRFQGTATVDIMHCVFEDNRAIADGGAIFHLGPGRLWIQDCVFNKNVVERQIAVPEQIVVTVFTGATGYGSSDIEGFPVWKVDGHMPDLQTGECGNETVYGDPLHDQLYRQSTLYSEVLTVSSGDHTLWIGLVVQRTVPQSTWAGGGWISIVSIVPKVYPQLCDNRASTTCPPPNNFAREPGCYQGDDSTAVMEGMHYCSRGGILWTSIGFNVPSGTGGAIAIPSTGAVIIQDSTFSNNRAGFGDALAATGLERLVVQQTEFATVTDNTFSLEAVSLETCEANPCNLGERCTLHMLSLHCVPCAPGEIGEDGIECRLCEPGKQPNAGQTTCIDCIAGNYSSAATAGVCEPCSPGKTSTDQLDACTDCPAGRAGTDGSCELCQPGHVSTAERVVCTECSLTQYTLDRQVCLECPVGRTPTLNGDACRCASGYYNSTFGFVRCYVPGQDFEKAPDQLASQALDECQSCMLLACISCDDGEVSVAAGFAVSETAVAAMVRFDELSGQRAVFPCPMQDVCVVSAGEDGAGGLTDCREGYAGPLCDSCAEGWSRPGLSGKCSRCNKTASVVWLTIGSLIVLGSVIGSLYYVSSHKRNSNQQIAMTQIVTLAKIAISLFQVLAQLDFTMDLSWPSSFQWFVDWLALLSFDVLAFLDIGCVGSYTYIEKCTFGFLVLPIMLLTIGVLHLFMTKRQGQDVRAVQMTTIRMVLTTTFLCFPFVAQTMFQGQDCRDLGEAESYLAVDYQIDCNSTAYIFSLVVSSIGVLLYPIGVPTVTFALLFKNGDEIQSGGAARQTFDFLIADYKIEYYYWDTLEMFRCDTTTCVSAIQVIAPSCLLDTNHCLSVNPDTVTAYCAVLDPQEGVVDG